MFFICPDLFPCLCPSCVKYEVWTQNASCSTDYHCLNKHLLTPLLFFCVRSEFWLSRERHLFSPQVTTIPFKSIIGLLPCCHRSIFSTLKTATLKRNSCLNCLKQLHSQRSHDYEYWLVDLFSLFSNLCVAVWSKTETKALYIVPSFQIYYLQREHVKRCISAIIIFENHSEIG